MKIGKGRELTKCAAKATSPKSSWCVTTHQGRLFCFMAFWCPFGLLSHTLSVLLRYSTLFYLPSEIGLHMMLTTRSWAMPLLRSLQHDPWPLSTAIPPRLDASQPVEEERTPYYDPSSFYPAQLGEVLNGRYQVATKLGYGSDSSVWLARDLHQFVCLLQLSTIC
jgi:hypothetical protein